MSAHRLPPAGGASLLPALEAIDALADEHVPAMLTHLSALRARLSARQTAALGRREPVADDLLDIEQTAALTRRSVSWLHHRGHTLPGFYQPEGKGGRKFWSRRALIASFTDKTGAC